MPFVLVEVLPILFGFIAMLVTIYFLIKSYYNYTYGFVASSEELKKYYNKLLDYKECEAGDKFLEFVTNEYSKYADINALNNDKKSSYIHKANGTLIILLVFVILSWIPYTWNLIHKSPNIQDINITNINKINDILQEKIDTVSKLEQIIMSNTSTIKRLNVMIEHISKEEEKIPDAPKPPDGRLIREGTK